MIYLLGYQEAKAMESKFDYSISINDHNKDPIFRVYGKTATLEMNFNDVWLDEKGNKTIWAGDRSSIVDPSTPLPGKENLDKIDEFLQKYPDFLQKESLIHCWAGVSRSSSILMYILLKNGYNYQDAILTILTERRIARPNLIMAGFMEQRMNAPGIVDHLKNHLDYTRLM